LEALRVRQEEFKAVKLNTLGAHTADEFRKHLKRMCGNVVRAWRLKLDLNGSGGITYNEFGPAVRSLGYEGSIRELWHALDDDDSGAITVSEIDPKEAEIVEDFKRTVMSQFSNATHAWQKIAPAGQKTLTKESFKQACNILGWEGDADHLFALLDSNIEICGHIGIHDIEWLGHIDTGSGADEDDDDAKKTIAEAEENIED